MIKYDFTKEGYCLAHINFKIPDELIEEIDEEIKKTGISKSDFYRACLENGFDNLTEYRTERKNILISFYIEQEKYRKLLQINKKYKLKMQKTYVTVFETGFDILMGLKFLGFLKIANGILKVEEVFKKVFN